MKKINIIMLLVLIFALSANFTKAEERGDVKNIRAEGKAKIGELRVERKDGMMALKNASSTMTKREMKVERTELFKNFKDEKREIMSNMKKDSFEVRKSTLVRQLNMTLENLANVRTRLNERIIKAEASGRNMTEAKAALVVADDKLAKARVAVDALKVYVATSTSGAAVVEATADVELVKPRQVGDAAIKAVKEARDSLKKVVELIAKNMGFKNDKSKVGTTTPTTN